MEGSLWGKSYYGNKEKISIAKAEMERIKENRKLTKRGRKNRTFLEKECRKILVPELVSYMEKYKMLLRKLKRGSCKKKVIGIEGAEPAIPRGSRKSV